LLLLLLLLLLRWVVSEHLVKEMELARYKREKTQNRGEQERWQQHRCQQLQNFLTVNVDYITYILH
jgi:hypothetical protein